MSRHIYKEATFNAILNKTNEMRIWWTQFHQCRN